MASQILNLALQLADLADSITLQRFHATDLVVETKPDATPVTDADKKVEELIRARLVELRPHDWIIGEEFGGISSLDRFFESDAQFAWIIDPIDGTKNFLRGVPTWATLIGVMNRNRTIVAGVVSAPALYRRWYAEENGGAWVIENSGAPKKLHVSSVQKLTDASLSYSDLVGWGERAHNFMEVLATVWRTRALGDFWSHVLVAEGAVDLSIEPALALWDMAPLDVIVREAGGRFTNIKGIDGPLGGSAVASNGILHEPFLSALNQNNSHQQIPEEQSRGN